MGEREHRNHNLHFIAHSGRLPECKCKKIETISVTYFIKNSLQTMFSKLLERFLLFMVLCCNFFQELPRQTKPKKGPKQKIHEFRPFWCFSLGKQAQFTLNFCSGMPLWKVHELTFLRFGLPGPLLILGKAKSLQRATLTHKLFLPPFDPGLSQGQTVLRGPAEILFILRDTRSDGIAKLFCASFSGGIWGIAVAKWGIAHPVWN